MKSLGILRLLAVFVVVILTACAVGHDPASTPVPESKVDSPPNAEPTVAPRVISPSPTPTLFNIGEVEQLLASPEKVVLVVLAKQMNTNPSDPVLQLWTKRLELPIRALPHIYSIHLLSVGGPESGHPLIDVEEFVIEYLASHIHYGETVSVWIEGVRANPCGASEDIRNALILLETEDPGVLDAAIVMATQPSWMAEASVRSIFVKAKGEIFDDPDAIKKRYRCTN